MLKNHPLVKRWIAENPETRKHVDEETLAEYVLPALTRQSNVPAHYQLDDIPQKSVSPEPDTSLTKELTSMIVIPDMQIPYVDYLALDAVEKYMQEHSFDWYVNIGDFIDVEALSHWNDGLPRKSEGKRLGKEFDIGNKILDRHQDIIRKNNPKAKFHFIYGNHEERVEKFLDKNPGVEGLFDVADGLRFKERGFTWTRNGDQGEQFSIGHANFTHGLKAGMGHSRGMAAEWDGNVFYGHVHDVQSHTLTSRGKSHNRIAQSLGCLCVYDMPYMSKKPSRWQQAFAIFYFKKDGSFNHYVPLIIDDEFISPEGKLYQGSICG